MKASVRDLECRIQCARKNFNIGERRFGREMGKEKGEGRINARMRNRGLRMLMEKGERKGERERAEEYTEIKCKVGFLYNYKTRISIF